MARDMEIPDPGVQRSPADKEALREALLDGTLSPAEVADRWPGGGRQAALIRSAFEQFEQRGYDTGTSRGRGEAVDMAEEMSGCGAAIDRAREAVDNLTAQGQVDQERPDVAARWHADETTRGAEIDLDLDGGAW